MFSVTLAPYYSVSHTLLFKPKACSFMDGTMTFNTNACNEAYSCKGIVGVASFGNSSCNGQQACMNLSGITTINDDACNGSGACINFANNVTVGECQKTLSLFNLEELGYIKPSLIGHRGQEL